MNESHAQRGQSLIEVLLLIALLGLIAGGVALIVGPGIGNVYSYVIERLPVAGEPAPAGAQCADLRISGSASFRDTDGDAKADVIHFGGLANCSQVSSAGPADDPLVARAAIGRLRCVALYPIAFQPDAIANVRGRLTFKLTTSTSRLEIRAGRAGPMLLTADLAPGNLTMTERAGSLTIAGVSGLEVADSIGSHTLAIFAGAPAVAADLAFPAPAAMLENAGSGATWLKPHNIPFTARISAACRR
jgi:hypothetical protein